MDIIFTSFFAKHFKNYLVIRHSMGIDIAFQERILREFDRFLTETNYSGTMCPNVVIEYLTERHPTNQNNYRQKYQVLKDFANYLSAYFPEQPLFPLGETRRPSHRPRPRIFTEEELIAILEQAKKISYHNIIRNKTLYASLALAMTCGLRRSEVTNLKLKHVDFERCIIDIRETKFGKNRKIPIGKDLRDILYEYKDFREQKYSHVACDKFFITMHKSSLSSSWFYQSFREVLEKIGISPRFGPGPHPHDLRHTFAVRRLVTWYKEGKDVQALLPALATYMGHVHYSDTAYYLTATAELLGLAGDYFQKLWNKEINNHE